MLTYYLFLYTSEPYVSIPLIVLGIIFFFKYDSVENYIPLILTITTLVYFLVITNITYGIQVKTPKRRDLRYLIYQNALIIGL